MTKCFSVICNYCSNFYYEKLSGTGGRKKKLSAFQLQDNYLDHIIYTQHLKQPSLHTKLGVFSKFCFATFGN